MVVRWTRWTLTRRKWAWGVSSQLLTSHHLLQTHSGLLGKHSKLFSQEVASLYLSQHTNSSYFKSKILVETSANLEPLSGKHWNSFISGIFLICWIIFQHHHTHWQGNQKTLSNHNVFSFLPRSDFVSCAMSRQPLSDSPITSNILLYTALCCNSLVFTKNSKHSRLFLLVFSNQYCTSKLIVVLRCFVSVWRQTANGGTNWKYWFHCFGSIGSLLIR